MSCHIFEENVFKCHYYFQIAIACPILLISYLQLNLLPMVARYFHFPNLWRNTNFVCPCKVCPLPYGHDRISRKFIFRCKFSYGATTQVSSCLMDQICVEVLELNHFYEVIILIVLLTQRTVCTTIRYLLKNVTLLNNKVTSSYHMNNCTLSLIVSTFFQRQMYCHLFVLILESEPEINVLKACLQHVCIHCL